MPGSGEEGFGLLLICYVSALSIRMWLRVGGTADAYTGRKGEDAGRRRASKRMRNVGCGGDQSGAELWVWRVPPITDAGVTVAGCGSFVR